MIEKYVSNFELSKEMKELGFLQESEFYWIFQYNVDRWIVQDSATIGFSSGGFDKTKIYSAYLVGELGKILPESIEIPDENMACYLLRWSKCPIGNDHAICSHHIFYIQSYHIYKTISDISEANARAKMAIYLKRKGLI